MIQEIIEIGPQHPYAGGMDSYGGVGGPPAGAAGGYHGAYSQQQPQYPPYQQHQQQGYEQGAYGQVSAYMPHGDGSGGGGYGQAAPVAMGGAGYGHHQAHSSQPYGGGGYAPQPVVPPRQAPLQVSAWKAAPAPDGQIYYYNERTGETQWEKPAGMP